MAHAASSLLPHGISGVSAGKAARNVNTPSGVACWRARLGGVGINDDTNDAVVCCRMVWRGQAWQTGGKRLT